MLKGTCLGVHLANRAGKQGRFKQRLLAGTVTPQKKYLWAASLRMSVLDFEYKGVRNKERCMTLGTVSRRRGLEAHKAKSKNILKYGLHGMD